MDSTSVGPSPERALDGCVHGFVDGHGVAAVHGLARHAVGLGLHRERLACRGVRVLLLDLV